MNANEYQILAARTLKSGEGVLDKISQDEIMILWNAVGAAGEAGEILEFVKKGIFHRHWDVEMTETLRKIMTKEIGDLIWYAAGICTIMGIEFEDVMTQNIEKLKRRYPSGFDYNDSLNRPVEVDEQMPMIIKVEGEVGIGMVRGEDEGEAS
jgi:NTP pyrophosphatase (non-canonical NTP hydrolase)